MYNWYSLLDKITLTIQDRTIYFRTLLKSYKEDGGVCWLSARRGINLFRDNPLPPLEDPRGASLEFTVDLSTLEFTPGLYLEYENSLLFGPLDEPEGLPDGDRAL